MKGNDEVIQVLQDVLCAELTAVNQYFIHARMCENWGYKKLAAYIRKESIEEMQHAQEIIDRILYFDGAPNMQKYMKINVGKTVPEQFAADLRGRVPGRPAPQQGRRGRARPRRQRHPRAPREDPRGRGGARGLARGAARADQGDGRRELPRAADGMRKATLALALGAAVALAAPAAFSQHPGPAPAGPRGRARLRGAAARRPGRDPPRRDPPPEPPAAHLRRPERRGLLERGRQEHRLPADERGRGRDVRPAVRGRRRDREEPHGLERQGPGDLRLLLRRRPARPLRLDPPRRPRLPAARRPLEGLRLADDRRLRHREPRPRRLRLPAPHRHARLRRRGHALAGREDDRLHLRPRRRPRDLHDGDRRDEREAPHARARLRRRPVLLPRRQAHRVPPRRPPRRGEPRPLQGAPRAAPLPRRARSRSGS